MTHFEQRVRDRLESLLQLRDGWLDGEGTAPGPGVISTAALVAEATITWAGDIAIYPTPAGGVQLEWSDERANHSITIGPDHHVEMATTDKTEAPHRYLSTGCFHGNHDYCNAMTGLQGAKRPAECKHCPAKCQCPCHS